MVYLEDAELSDDNESESSSGVEQDMPVAVTNAGGQGQALALLANLEDNNNNVNNGEMVGWGILVDYVNYDFLAHLINHHHEIRLISQRV